VLVNDIE